MEKPKIVIVDEDNNVIGAKMRDKVDYEKDIYRSTGIWLTSSNNRVLLAQRKLTKDKDPGKWGPAAAGTVDEGETYLSNAYKELEEELGLSDVELKEGPQQFVSAPRRQFIQWFIGQTDAEIASLKLQESEVETAVWRPIQELIEDVKDNPDKYVPMMYQALKVLGY
jgi:isopentenyldiphosphate isomerase